MKKLSSFLMALVMCLSLCACGGDDGFDAEYASMIGRVEKLNGNNITDYEENLNRFSKIANAY